MTDENKIVGPDGQPPESEPEAPAEETPDEPVVASEEPKPCGCHVLHMSDKTVRVLFCPPHALQQCAIALDNAAGALHMAANRLIKDQAEMVAAQQVKQGKRAIDKGILKRFRGRGK